MFGKKKKEKLSKEQQAKVIKEKRVQDLINVRDIEGGKLYTKDNYIQGYIRVLPVNISLLSNAEKKRKRDIRFLQLRPVLPESHILIWRRKVLKTRQKRWDIR